MWSRSHLGYFYYGITGVWAFCPSLPCAAWRTVSLRIQELRVLLMRKEEASADAPYEVQDEGEVEGDDEEKG